MSSVILRTLLGSLFVLGLVFPGIAMAEDNAQPEKETVLVQADTDTYQQADDDRMSEVDEDAYQASGEGRRNLGTILAYTVYGGGIGTLVGFAGYVISGFDWTPWTIAGFAGGGALAGAGIGTYRVLTQDQDQMSASSVEYMNREVPKAVQLPVFKMQF